MVNKKHVSNLSKVGKLNMKNKIALDVTRRRKESVIEFLK